MGTGRSRVLHIWYGYSLGKTTWLYRLLSNMRRWSPTIFSEPPADGGAAMARMPWPKDRLFFQLQVARRGLIQSVWSCLRGEPLPPGRSRRESLKRARLAQILRDRRFDLIHVHFGGAAVKPHLRHLPLPKIVSLYGSDVFRFRPRYHDNLRQLLHDTRAFVVTSVAVRDGLVALGLPDDRIHVIPVGIDADDFPPQAELAKRRGAPARGVLEIVTVGNLVACKAPHVLPLVARILREKGVRFKWTMVGDGPLRERVFKEIERQGVREQFRMTGYVPFDGVRKLLWDSDVMVHNATVAPDGTREALGVALMEGGAMGLPVVSCRVGGIPEVVVDGQTGLLVGEGELDVMADRIAALAQDDEMRCQMGMAASRRVRACFDSARLAAQMEDLYDRLL